jgi:hypothetical protein
MPETQTNTFLSNSPASKSEVMVTKKMFRKPFFILLIVGLIGFALGLFVGLFPGFATVKSSQDTGNSSQSSTTSSETTTSVETTTSSSASTTSSVASSTTTSTPPVIEGWTRKEFSFDGDVKWDVYYPTGSMLFEAGLDEGGLGIFSSANGVEYDFSFSYPKGEIGTTIDAWVAADSVAYAGPGGKVGTVADKNGVEVRVVKDVKNSSAENTAYVYIWNFGETNRRLVYITTNSSTTNLNAVVDKFVLGLNPAI